MIAAHLTDRTVTVIATVIELPRERAVG